MNRKTITVYALLLLLTATAIGAYAGTIGVNDLFGFTNGYGFTWINSTNIDVTDYYRGGDNYTATIETLIAASSGLNPFDQSLNTTDAVTFDTVTSGEYFLNAVNKTDILKYPQHPASYILWEDGGTYYSKNGITGQVLTYATPQTAIQAAHDAMPSNGGVINMLRGNYSFTGQVNITKESVRIIGETFGTWFNDGVYIANTVSDVFNVYDADSVTLKNFMFGGLGGSGNTQVAINITNTDYFIVENIRVRNYGTSLLLSNADWGNIRNVIMPTCAINGTAISLESGSSRNFIEDVVLGTGSIKGTVLLNISGDGNQIVGAQINGGNNISLPEVGIDVYGDFNSILGLEVTDFLANQPIVRFNAGSDRNTLIYNNDLDYTDNGAYNLIETYRYGFVTAPFTLAIDGATATVDGIEIDAAGEDTAVYVVLPDDCGSVITVEAWALSNVAHASEMRAELWIKGGTDNEPEETHVFYDGNRASVTTNFSNNDYIYWSTSSANLNGFSAGDVIGVVLTYEVANAGDSETDCDFEGVRIIYETN